jgi:hypothetical protein
MTASLNKEQQLQKTSIGETAKMDHTSKRGFIICGVSSEDEQDTPCPKRRNSGEAPSLAAAAAAAADLQTDSAPTAASSQRCAMTEPMPLRTLGKDIICSNNSSSSSSVVWKYDLVARRRPKHIVHKNDSLKHQQSGMSSLQLLVGGVRASADVQQARSRLLSFLH